MSVSSSEESISAQRSSVPEAVMRARFGSPCHPMKWRSVLPEAQSKHNCPHCTSCTTPEQPCRHPFRRERFRRDAARASPAGSSIVVMAMILSSSIRTAAHTSRYAAHFSSVTSQVNNSKCPAPVACTALSAQGTTRQRPTADASCHAATRERKVSSARRR